MEKVLSLIIPTYNMEKYLKKCLDSLIVDNMDLLEVLIVNDGSNDRSSEIAHEYEIKYPNTFRVIDKNNGNYGSCINRGLKEVTGKYVKILDADDSFYTEHFNDFLDIIKDIDVDLILTDFITVDDNGKEITRSNYNLPTLMIQDFKEIFKEKKIDFQINMHAVTYKKQNLIDINYTQTEGISYTDMEWVYTPMTTVNTGIYFKIPIYKYLVGRPGQTMDLSIRKRQIGHLMKMSLSLSERYEANNNMNYSHYLKKVAISQLSQIYYQGLVKDNCDLDSLKQFDKDLNNKCRELYQAISILQKCKIKYVTYWRTHKMIPLPFYMKLLFKIKDTFSCFL